MKARVPQNTINRTCRTGTISLVHLGKSNKKSHGGKVNELLAMLQRSVTKNSNYATDLLKHTIERKNYVAIAA